MKCEFILRKTFDIIDIRGGGDMDKRIKYRNDYTKNNYDRINLVVPKGTKEKLKAAAQELGLSMNEYIYKLIAYDLAAGASKMGSRTKVLKEDIETLLRKWQIPKKYYEMIQEASYDKEDGYYIQLKDGYINDATQDRTIRCKKTSEIRMLVNKSHKKEAG